MHNHYITIEHILWCPAATVGYRLVLRCEIRPGHKGSHTTPGEGDCCEGVEIERVASIILRTCRLGLSDRMPTAFDSLPDGFVETSLSKVESDEYVELFDGNGTFADWLASERSAIELAAEHAYQGVGMPMFRPGPQGCREEVTA